jgi:hypothetical protein
MIEQIAQSHNVSADGNQRPTRACGSRARRSISDTRFMSFHPHEWYLGWKCGLFISGIENLCRESNEPLVKIDYTGLDLEASLKKLSFHILKLITAKRSVDLRRLAIGEAANCPEVGDAWYTHDPAKNSLVYTISVESRHKELRKTAIPIDRIAVILHDSDVGIEPSISRQLLSIDQVTVRDRPQLTNVRYDDFVA